MNETNLAPHRIDAQNDRLHLRVGPPHRIGTRFTTYLYAELG